MKSVTQRIKEIKQPVGGYINPKLFDLIEQEDGNVLYDEENINPGLVGLVIDYMTRFLNSGDKEEAFKISLMGAKLINETRKAYKLLENINGIDEDSIISACKLCGYDVCLRASITYFKNVDEINPNKETIHNINIMIKRGLTFFKEYGPVIKDGITFRGGYTSIISSGDADFITYDTLWDFKVSKKSPTKDHTLQLIVYYLLGIHSYECDFSNIKKIGIFNPRKNTVYLYELKNISENIIKEIEKEVIGYKNNKIQDSNFNIMTIKDIMDELNISRSMVMKYYANYGLPLRKEKNKYIIERNDYLIWIEEMKKLKERQESFTIIITIIVLFLLFVFGFALT